MILASIRFESLQTMMSCAQDSVAIMSPDRIAISFFIFLDFVYCAYNECPIIFDKIYTFMSGILRMVFRCLVVGDIKEKCEMLAYLSRGSGIPASK